MTHEDEREKEGRMRKILVTEWVSLDGFTAGANGEMDWITAGEDNGEYQNEVVTQADTLLLGRTTYESFAGAWPQRAKDPNTDPGERAFAQRFCDMRKVVISQSLPTVEWEHSTLLREIDPAKILKLKQEPGKDIAIYGSASIVRALTDLGLIDEYQLTVHPVALGSGKALFGDIQRRANLKLIKNKVLPSGVVRLYYEYVGNASGRSDAHV